MIKVKHGEKLSAKHFCVFFFFFFDLDFTAHQDYFTRFEPSQLIGGVKMGDPLEKPPDHP